MEKLRPINKYIAGVIFVICLIIFFIFIRSGGKIGFPNTGTLGALSLQVVGTTNTQAVLSYTAPDTNSCTVEVSENSSLTPLVHDVDSSLFAGSNLDSRGEAISNNTFRIFVVGKRVTEKALDGNNYSRALQAYTTHYYKVTCGSTVETGSFTTANIPFGMTYQDVPQMDKTNPGVTLNPTLLNDRTQKIIDPHTGALIQRVSLPVDTNQTGPFMYFGGSTRICSNNLMGSPAIGYLCSFSNGDGGYGLLYYIIPSTGESRYLGYVSGYPYPHINPVDGKFYEQSGNSLLVRTYSGDYSAAAPNSSASFSDVNIANDIPAAIHAFNNNFVIGDFGCGVAPVFGDYAIFSCGRAGQDSYGWLAVVRVSTGTVIAAMQMYQNAQYRWTAIHHVDPEYDQPAVMITTHGLVGSTAGSQLGLGPYITTYTGGSSLQIGSTTLTVSGEPSCSACGVDPDLPAAQIGDSFTFADTGEAVKITAKNSPTSWNITQTTQTHASGTILTANGNYNPFLWKFLIDPNGTDTTGTSVLQELQLDGHFDITTDLLLMEHWMVRTGDLLTQAGHTWTRTITESPSFAGASAQCYGNGCASHPSAAAPGRPWLTDYLRWDGSNADAGTISLISGQLYQFNSGGSQVSLKIMAQAAGIGQIWNGGPHSLIDASGPGSLLSTGSLDNYKYCIANAIGECYTGSAKGDIFMNLPGSPNTTCGLAMAPCFNNFDAYANDVLQIGISGTQSRVISGGLTGLGDMNNYPSAKALADGSWLLFTIGDTQYHTPSHLMMAKLPPFVAQDNVDRTTFVRAPLTITPPSGQGITSALVEFGYTEQGTQAEHYCTSRREACVATSATVTDADPFYFEQTDSYTKMPCSTSCTITLPVLPMHVAYYQVKYFDTNGTFVANGDYGVASESAIANINNLSYTVNSSVKTITAFNFDTLSPAVLGVVNEGNHTIALTVPFGTNLAALVPTITIVGASVSQNSGIANNFTNPVNYLVTADDSSTQNYVVTVTAGSDTTAPVRSLGSPTGTQVFGTTSVSLALSTDKNATCKYSTSAGTPYSGMTAFTTTGTTTHSKTLSGLTNGTSYTYYVKCQDVGLNTNTTDYPITFNISSDTSTPIVSITSPADLSTVRQTINVNADASDLDAVGGVKFYYDDLSHMIGTEDLLAPESVPLDTTTLTDGPHTIFAVARDIAGNIGTSTNIHITVHNGSPVESNVLPIILPLGTTSTTLSITTDEISLCKYSTLPSTSFGSMTSFSFTNSTNHSTPIINLQNGTSYAYYIKCSDTLGNTNVQDYVINFSVQSANVAPAASSGGGGLVGNIPPPPTSTSTTPPTAIKPTIPPIIDFSVILGCDNKNTGFSTTTGKSCALNIVKAVVTNLSVIAGCDNKTTGFSTFSGQSCLLNISTPTTKTSYNFGTLTLGNGSIGPDVMELQRFLNKFLNLKLAIDGILGPKTIAVIKKWQLDNGLVSDGLVGPKTKALMNLQAEKN